MPSLSWDAGFRVPLVAVWSPSFRARSTALRSATITEVGIEEGYGCPHELSSSIAWRHVLRSRNRLWMRDLFCSRGLPRCLPYGDGLRAEDPAHRLAGVAYDIVRAPFVHPDLHAPEGRDRVKDGEHAPLPADPEYLGGRRGRPGGGLRVDEEQRLPRDVSRDSSRTPATSSAVAPRAELRLDEDGLRPDGLDHLRESSPRTRRSTQTNPVPPLPTRFTTEVSTATCPGTGISTTSLFVVPKTLVSFEVVSS